MVVALCVTSLSSLIKVNEATFSGLMPGLNTVTFGMHEVLSDNKRKAKSWLRNWVAVNYVNTFVKLVPLSGSYLCACKHAGVNGVYVNRLTSCLLLVVKCMHMTGQQFNQRGVNPSAEFTAIECLSLRALRLIKLFLQTQSNYCSRNPSDYSHYPWSLLKLLFVVYY